ncbi:hypothetical protein MFRU_037g00440 [Monilinia fructicola]|nr:hypothetical protein MFRU_037g00440 [Monilinia fructicola]
MVNIRIPRFSRFDRLDWSMFTEDWSFETATSTRGDVESIEPDTNPLNPNQALEAHMSVTERELIPTHPAIKFLDQTLTIELGFEPKLRPESTEITTLEQILPQYGAMTKFVTFLIQDLDSTTNTHKAQKEHAQQIENTKRIIFQLRKFQNVSCLHVKLSTDKPEHCLAGMVSVLLELSFKNMTLTIVWPYTNCELNFLI